MPATPTAPADLDSLTPTARYQWARSFVMTFGQHKGSTLAAVAADDEGRGYLDWIADKPNFGDPTAQAAARAYRAGRPPHTPRYGGGASYPEAPTPKGDPRRLEVIAFLREALDLGPMTSSGLYALGSEAGFTRAEMEAARKPAGIKSVNRHSQVWSYDPSVSGDGPYDLDPGHRKRRKKWAKRPAWPYGGDRDSPC